MRIAEGSVFADSESGFFPPGPTTPKRGGKKINKLPYHFVAINFTKLKIIKFIEQAQKKI